MFEDLDDLIGGKWESLRKQAERRMGEIKVWEEPPRSVTVHYMTWCGGSPYSGQTGPRGIVAVAEGGRKVRGVAFPGYEDDVPEWNHYINIPENPHHALEVLIDAVGTRGFLGEAREMTGHSWEDATQRALYAFAEEIYARTNRCVF